MHAFCFVNTREKLVIGITRLTWSVISVSGRHRVAEAAARACAEPAARQGARPSFVRGPTPRRHLEPSPVPSALWLPVPGRCGAGVPSSDVLRARGSPSVPVRVRERTRARRGPPARDDGPRACEEHGAAARSEPGRARHRHGMRLVRRGARRHRAQQAHREKPQGRWRPGREGHQAAAPRWVFLCPSLAGRARAGPGLY